MQFFHAIPVCFPQMFPKSRGPIHFPWVPYMFWLVVWTPVKNISQLGWLFPKYGKIKHVPNHQPVFHRSPLRRFSQKTIVFFHSSDPGFPGSSSPQVFLRSFPFRFPSVSLLSYLVAHPTNRKWGLQPWWFQWDKRGQCPLTGVN